MSGCIIKAGTLAIALSAALAGSAAAQTRTAPANPVQQQPRDPNMPAPHNTVPEKIDSTGSTGSLSERLDRTDGVIRPPDTGPDMTVRPPVPNPGTTPVIPPPGSPGGNPRLDPK
ncbi:hypothetical protein [Enterovirga aerilata]|uniref:Uncharacterized protein n=1 Tax=Enterovirga aerilata TaxID=2730920 RepID=A0A849I1J8_9HYPH|nr:hypothetical protein [Enterovirga sp. DB1703]NNM73656.1 hypothetical protein [Enterovirga sp. DB1703]